VVRQPLAPSFSAPARPLSIVTERALDSEVAVPVDHLPKRYEETLTRIASAALRHRPVAESAAPAAIRLVAISKGHPAVAIRRLAELGQRDFGENYLQEALPKLAALADLALTWHYTGQLQANKTRTIAEHFDWVHALDRERIAMRLNEQRPAAAAPIDVCIQVRLEDEPGKGGVEPHEVAALAGRIREFPRLRLRGLMCIPPPRQDFQEQRAQFERVADCLHDLQARGFAVDTLSMGMSEDLEAAIAAGATLLRIGTAIFGERPRDA
jgi:pyridoxal phosphate enzyme (YggS family)